MLECPSCQQALPPHARFCTRCGVRLSITTTPVATVPPGERYMREKRELAARGPGITSAMLSLLPFVYENRRAENKALFASTVESNPPLEDPIWGRVAFVLGAYGNYMYRYPLNAQQKQQVWQALLWSVFYERCFRRKYLPQRLQQLLHFLHGCVDDTLFVSSALEDLEALRPYLEASSLKRALESLRQLPEPPEALLQHLDEQLTAALERLTSAASQPMHVPGHPIQPQGVANPPAQLDPPTNSPEAWLTAYTPDPAHARNIIEYTLDLRSSAANTHKRGKRKHSASERGPQATGRASRLKRTPGSHVGHVQKHAPGTPQKSVQENRTQADIQGRRLEPALQPDISETSSQSQPSGLVQSLSTDGLRRTRLHSREEIETGPVETHIHSHLAFLDEAQRLEFFASLRAARLETLNQLLRTARRELLTALSKELAADEYTYQAPRKPIRLGRKSADRFVEAQRLLDSTQASEQLIALRLFELGARETTHPDYTRLAREWMLYARAVVQGSTRVIDDWEELYQRGEASWEEMENLAIFYQQTGYPAEALRVLLPEIEAWRAPVSHVRLALACALDLLLDPNHSGPLSVLPGKSARFERSETKPQELPESTPPAYARIDRPGQVESVLQEEARAFLLAHLEHWPHPLCCLTWLVLAQEVHGPLHPRQQAQWLSAFQELTEQPQPVPDPAHELPEAQLADLEERLARKERCEEGWFFWINDYAERHPHKYAAWSRLVEVSERLGHLTRTETALQHLVEMQYHRDYARYQEGTPLPRARFLRDNLEKLFEFYLRHRLLEQGAEAFNSCYPALSHLWDTRDPLNRRLLTLTAPYLEMRQRVQVQVSNTHHELNAHELSRTKTMPLETFQADRRVGIFVDYENIAHFIPRTMEIEEVGRALATYAASFGQVVCQWASASPQNLSNLAEVRVGLEAARFQVRFPRRELQFSPSKKNLADFALLECLSEAAASERPDIYLIVSGDRDYYERVCSLLDAGHSVRVIAAADSQHLSSRYRELEQQRARSRQQAGYAESNFFIDDLEEILCPLVQMN